MVEGWILDVHLRTNSDLVTVWIKEDSGFVSEHTFRWSPVVHVSGSPDALSDLEKYLLGSICQSLFGSVSVKRSYHLLSHDSNSTSQVLSVKIPRASDIIPISRVIADRGEWNDYEIFSVDPKPAQKFLYDMGTHPFGRVKLGNGRIEALDSRLDKEWNLPKVRIASFSVDMSDENSIRNQVIRSVTVSDITPKSEPRSGEIITIKMDSGRSVESFVSEIERSINWLNPDILVTMGGDITGFPAIISLASSAGLKVRLGRKKREVVVRREAITNWSYGRIVRSEAYHALEGRVHIDSSSSFIFKEGGIEGLFELSRMSGIPCQDLSRLSPGSAISAIQVRQSMEDGVLVPWKKNRPEDMKTGRQMLLADRGGLYLDPIPGVHEGVYELDFSSLFPSIIATRNISPETINCDCCIPPNMDDVVSSVLPLCSEEASEEIQSKKGKQQGLKVPELDYHTCMSKHGFLGRVVSPIIKIRSEMKKKIVNKGDSWDKRQNALKWLLVTCFGYTGYRNARFGRIECHEAICSWSREILLEAKSAAEEEGWECLHAIVDSIWLKDRMDREEFEQRDSIERLMCRIVKDSGIPIELEDRYDWIAFVPNRTTGSSSLTKYFAYGKKGWKIRGIETRQHSTCEWIKSLQMRILSEINEKGYEEGVRVSIEHYQKEIIRMKQGLVPLSDLIISRRINNELNDYRVLNLTAAALMREERFTSVTPPGRKIRFVVVGIKRKIPQDRVRICTEIDRKSPSIEGESGDSAYYTGLASRAVFSILAPFGVSMDELQNSGSKQTRLDSWSLLKTLH